MSKFFYKKEDHAKALQDNKCVLKSINGAIGYFANGNSSKEICFVELAPHKKDLNIIGGTYVSTEEEYNELLSNVQYYHRNKEDSSTE